MKTVKDILVENLIRLRKDSKLTQLELAEKVGYSDKAVSRWEHGEVMPDIDTLEKLAEVYNIPFTSLFTEKVNAKKERLNKKPLGNKLIISLLAVLSVWVIMFISFILFKSILGISLWQLFVLGAPISFLLGIIFSAIWGKRKYLFICISLFSWTALAYIHLQLIVYNLWMLYIVGIPIQIMILLSYKFKKHN